ncbi:hypothetical protein Tco_0321071 [Tanacetum coccineum]
MAWFSSLKPRHDDFVVEERLIWLEIEGVPIRAWNNDAFNQICSKWGEVLFMDGTGGCNSKHLCIKSSHVLLVFSSILLTLNNVTYAIRVREIYTWTPTFVASVADIMDDIENVKIRWIVVYAPQNLLKAGERYGSVFNDGQAELFNEIIIDASLIDIPLVVFNYTWTDKWRSKMSKLDRFLVLGCFYGIFPHIQVSFWRKPTGISPSLDADSLNPFSLSQRDYLKHQISHDEIKKAVWDCGGDRVPVLVNGSPTYEFELFKGLRQGDPLSPFLFILAIEGLHAFTCKAKELGLFKGAFIGQDNMLKINVHKSNVLGICVSDEEVSYMENVIGCEAAHFPLKYLGVLMPVFVRKKLEPLRNNFFIGGDQDEKKITWVKWKRCLASKKHGGLGIGSIFRLNIGLLFKWI